MDDLSAKVFRTYNASITLQSQLEENKPKIKDSATVDQKLTVFNECNRKVALLCNHQKAVSKTLNEQLDRIQQVIDKKQAEVKELETHKKKLKSNKPPAADPAKKLPKTPEACQEKIKKLNEQITAEKFKLQNKKDNSNVALETSKINYMDPRITISWCKRNEMPIEKVFNKTLRSKFTWAMDNDPAWIF